MSGSYPYPDLKLEIPDHMNRPDEAAKFGASHCVLLKDWISLIEPLAEEERRRNALKENDDQSSKQANVTDNRVVLDSGSSDCSCGRASIEEIHAFLGPEWDVREFRGEDIRQTYPPLENSGTVADSQSETQEIKSRPA